jgi:hypothetical protein
VQHVPKVEGKVPMSAFDRPKAEEGQAEWAERALKNANVTLMDADDKVRGVCCVHSIPRVSVHETSADEEADCAPRQNSGGRGIPLMDVTGTNSHLLTQSPLDKEK